MVILVTSYKNPDLDGVACAYAYAEFLRKKGKDVVAGVMGEVHPEVEFVLAEIGIPTLPDAEEFLGRAESIVLVDTSEPDRLPSGFPIDKVVEVIDHRKVHNAQGFPHARVQIEGVGSAATLIAERFRSGDVEVSRESAALLFSAIVSNTIDFMAQVTTGRDQDAAAWLSTTSALPAHYVQRMFTAKSDAIKKDLERSMRIERAVMTLGGRNVSIVQLEILDAEELVRSELPRLMSVLDRFKKETGASIVFLSCIDIGVGLNVFVVADDEARALVEEVLEVEFSDGIAVRQGILMRKEIVPLLKRALEEKK